MSSYGFTNKKWRPGISKDINHAETLIVDEIKSNPEYNHHNISDLNLMLTTTPCDPCIKNLKNNMFKNIFFIVGKFDKDRDTKWNEFSNIKIYETNLTHQKQKILELLELYSSWVKKVKIEAIKNYKENNFNYKYIWFKNINWKSILADKIVDCSKIGNRVWSAKYEFRRLILSL